jgi:micrococcal nuclease
MLYRAIYINPNSPYAASPSEDKAPAPSLLLRSIVLTLVLSLTSFLSICQTTLTGKVVSIADGDTFTLLVVGNKQIKIRLHGVDCPEKSQDFGTKARQFTSNYIFGKTINVEVKNTDRYGRKIGLALLPHGAILNEDLLAAGLAWHYKEYDNTQKYARLENHARKQKAGLWPGAAPIAPWEFRRVGKKRNVSSGSHRAPTSHYSNSIKASSTCGALTKTGVPCRRIVSGGGRCWQHI